MGMRPRAQEAAKYSLTSALLPASSGVGGKNMRFPPEIVDISRESEATRRLYGIGQKETTEFGTRCLLARRMIAQGGQRKRAKPEAFARDGRLMSLLHLRR